MNKRFLSVVVLITILIYGFFKPWFCEIFSIPISYLIRLFGFDPESLLKFLNSFSLATDFKEYYLGWFIYYPTYLLFHLLFIFILFREKTKVRNKIAFGLVVLVTILIGSTIVSNAIGFVVLFEISYKLFQNLFTLPFILLVIEGGKVFISDIDKLLRNSKEDK